MDMAMVFNGQVPLHVAGTNPWSVVTSDAQTNLPVPSEQSSMTTSTLIC